jgi:hypothetical protein
MICTTCTDHSCRICCRNVSRHTQRCSIWRCGRQPCKVASCILLGGRTSVPGHRLVFRAPLPYNSRSSAFAGDSSVLPSGRAIVSRDHHNACMVPRTWSQLSGTHRRDSTGRSWLLLPFVLLRPAGLPSAPLLQCL